MTQPPHHDEVAPLLKGSDLVVSLQGHTILAGVDAHVMPQETVALLGGNGSGKTTLVRTLLGLTPVVSGSRELFGTDLAHFRDWNKVGYVPQRGSLQLANATVEEVVSTGRLGHRRPFVPLRRRDREAIDTALERVGLAERRHSSFLRLSGGQQQRTLIARALCTGPELLVLDEPLAGLDTSSQASLASVLSELKAEGMGILVVLHELGPIHQLIDRSIVLRQGKVIHDGHLLPGDDSTDHHHDLDQFRTATLALGDPTRSFT
ncbi:metal ABC transporter ATP-binding protein [Luteococcus sp.]|uniref:metal ABC transporter ATP-binding protein n=1 Tax=Luteococcus sp. TaxID=1969402 RepID=UPI003734FF09